VPRAKAVGVIEGRRSRRRGRRHGLAPSMTPRLAVVAPGSDRPAMSVGMRRPKRRSLALGRLEQQLPAVLVGHTSCHRQSQPRCPGRPSWCRKGSRIHARLRGGNARAVVDRRDLDAGTTATWTKTAAAERHHADLRLPPPRRHSSTRFDARLDGSAEHPS
jgi:hypothetical protein